MFDCVKGRGVIVTGEQGNRARHRTVFRRCAYAMVQGDIHGVDGAAIWSR